MFTVKNVFIPLGMYQTVHKKKKEGLHFYALRYFHLKNTNPSI